MVSEDLTFDISAGLAELKNLEDAHLAMLRRMGEAERRSRDGGPVTKARGLTEQERALKRLEAAYSRYARRAVADIQTVRAQVDKGLLNPAAAERSITRIREGFHRMANRISADARAAGVDVSAGLGDALRRVDAEAGDVQRTASRMGRVFEVALGVTAANAAAVLANKIRQAVGATVAVGADFERAMDRVGAVSRATADEQAALERAAREAGAATVFSATQAAEALGYLAMAGFRSRESIAALPSVLQLAASAEIDLGRAADITSNILTAYRFGAEDLARVNDVLVGGFTSSNVTLDMLGESFKYVGPVAKGAGVGFEELAAMIGELGDAGIQGSMAGTVLRGAITTLIAPTKTEAAELKRLGVSALDAHGNLRPMADVLDDLRESGASTADVMRLFGDRAGPGMVALLAAGGDALRAFTGELEGTAGVAEEIAARQMDNLRGDVEELGGALQELALTLYEDAKPGLRGMTQEAADLARALGENWDAVETGARLVGVLVVAVAAYNVATQAAALWTARYTLAARAAAAAQAALNWVTRANPFALLVSVLAAAGAALLLFRDRAARVTAEVRAQREEVQGLVADLAGLSGAEAYAAERRTARRAEDLGKNADALRQQIEVLQGLGSPTERALEPLPRAAEERLRALGMDDDTIDELKARASAVTGVLRRLTQERREASRAEQELAAEVARSEERNADNLGHRIARLRDEVQAMADAGRETEALAAKREELARAEAEMRRLTGGGEGGGGGGGGEPMTAEERRKAEEERRRRQQQAFEDAQAEIDAMEEGTERVVAQIRLDAARRRSAYREEYGPLSEEVAKLFNLRESAALRQALRDNEAVLDEVLDDVLQRYGQMVRRMDQPPEPPDFGLDLIAAMVRDQAIPTIALADQVLAELNDEFAHASTDEARAQIGALIAELERLKVAMGKAKEAAEAGGVEIGVALQQGLSDAIIGASEAIGRRSRRGRTRSRPSARRCSNRSAASPSSSARCSSRSPRCRRRGRKRSSPTRGLPSPPASRSWSSAA